MSKELIQDVKQPKRRLAEVLPKPDNRRRPIDEPLIVKVGSGRRARHTVIWAVLIVMIVFIPLIYLVSQTLARAVVTVTPKQATLAVADTLRAVALPAEIDVERATKIGFQVMMIQATEKMSVAATEKSPVAERASGRIIVTNLYSSRPQKLVTNTRFEATGGKIYRIKEEATIPGYVLTDGKIKAGELTVIIQADRPGPEYNGEVKTLTIPGFKGDQRYDKITARGEGPLAGGFTGERWLVAPGAKLNGEKELTTRLTKELESEATASLPEGFIFYRGGEFLKFQSQTEDNDSVGQLTLKMDGELTVLIFSKRELSRRLAALHLPDYDQAEVEIENLGALQFSLLNQDDFAATDIKEIKEISLRLTGVAQLVWQFDAVTLKHVLVGVPKSDYERVFIKYPSIAKAEVTIQPPWLTRFPSDPAKIKVEIVGGLTDDLMFVKIMLSASRLGMEQKTKENEVITGMVTEALPNVLFRVTLDSTGEQILAYLAGKMRWHRIKVLVGDRVELWLDPYGGKARIIKRL